MNYTDIYTGAKSATASLRGLGPEQRNAVISAVADAVEESCDALLSANALDLQRMSPDNPLRDRLALTPGRISSIASDMRNVATLPDPLGRILEDRTLPNGLRLRKVSVPFGVVGVIFEARPNVIFDVFSLCFKSGNACVMKGGSDASCSNEAAIKIIRRTLSSMDVDERSVTLLPSTHEATESLLGAVGFVDLLIPRGGRRLIDFVRDNSRVPCIETGAGVVHAYVDASADIPMATAIVNNSKTRRVSVCNALDCLIVHKNRLQDLPAICAPLSLSKVGILADDLAYEALTGSYPAELLHHSSPEDYGTEFMAYRMAVKTVSGIDEAISHISRFGSGHSECIITRDEVSAALFQQEVDAACVYVNAPTSFTDGAQFGLGAEIGISTQKLGARGPMGLREITTYKWLINGDGQLRPK